MLLKPKSLDVCALPVRYSLEKQVLVKLVFEEDVKDGIIADTS